MKIKSLLLAFLFGSIILAFFFYSMVLNTRLGLPTLNSPLLDLVGVVLVLIGLSVHLASIYLFKLVGKGTPVPIEPPKKFVYTGLYKFVRNPMYLAIFTDILGGFFIFGHLLSLIYAFLFLSIIHIYVVLIEEPKLKMRFGKEYQEYTKSVPRWVPKVVL